MLDIAQPKVELAKSGQNYARFTVEPLSPGYGTTLGNALRRILLSSLPGTAITKIRISDVWHEFSTIPHVREDVTEIVLNVKRVRLQSDDNLQETRVRLSWQGKGAITAGDIAWPFEITCVNPAEVIAHVEDDAGQLEMELTVDRGRAYRSAEAAENLVIGEIPVDAIFTPIPRVNFVVEHTRVGHMTDYDRLILEVWTDGTIDPSDALKQAAEILQDHAQLIVDFATGGSDEPAGIGPYVTPEAEAKLLSELGLSSRVLNALRSQKIDRVGQVLKMNPDDLMGIRNFGPKSLSELQEKLRVHGFLGPNRKLIPDDYEAGLDGADDAATEEE
jgi:DNA-directed RNA polymerase subunit alpha